MSTVTTVVQILDSEYPIRCAEDELDDLATSARELDDRMRQIRAEGKVGGLDRLAIMAALNIARERVRMRRRLDAAGREVDELTTRLRQAIEHAGPARPDR